ncbi:general secretion pathway protein GspD [Vibrio vulnificus]|uniref:type II and III secretion system protein family protein n=1 Tax=Vibrio vulnificus TaxID=672 RepID=UPI00050509DF|nr:pilus assembly protein N-terminal domain-containing protein [Vibrio vulnificus]EHG1329788.1 general secretion pathway protein GspD [Vibrio vulnificus]EHZ2549573.1 pilus assembly protein N-terminal domain-containing protein [Vibrio vulnificus]EHZ2744480.1 pilus assembly protein N-terminal domain-containing protein [Vibrio vulnificus]EIE1223980.1 pilus assembly protein N-terminal domain-containing protein [Vibrio vulnificus]EIO3982872.1 pilus assembly protein N-terminal domain-containing prot
MKKTLMCLLITTIGFASLSVNSNELMNLNQGSAKTISLKRQISTVFVGDPEIADYKIIDETKVVVYGVGQGATSVIVYDRAGNELYNAEVVVNKSLRLVKQTLIARFPDESINITNVGEQVVLDGVVSSDEIKTQIYRTVGEMLKKNPTRNTYKLKDTNGDEIDSLDYTATYIYDNIINNLKVLTTEQINVKLTVAEVSSSFLSELGVSYSDSGQAGRFVNKLLDFTAQDIVAVITASGDDQIGRVLAEPNLSVISGETASFLVGGEIPIAIRDEDGITISYKEYGVKLSMVAKVTDSENIRLSLLPEVSSIDEENKTANGLINVPALRTRKAQTTVQLKDGQSFVLAGLLTSEERESLSKIPVLGDIPILGALFSHTKSNQTKTELIIVATVNLVDPVKAEDIKLPSFRRTSDIERLLRIDLSSMNEPELEDTLNKGGFN